MLQRIGSGADVGLIALITADAARADTSPSPRSSDEARLRAKADAGEGRGGGWPHAQRPLTPTPDPSPQGGREQNAAPIAASAGFTLVDEFAEEPAKASNNISAVRTVRARLRSAGIVRRSARRVCADRRACGRPLAEPSPEPAIESAAAEAVSEEAIAETIPETVAPESEDRPQEPSPQEPSRQEPSPQEPSPYVEAVADEPEPAASPPAQPPAWLDEAAMRTAHRAAALHVADGCRWPLLARLRRIHPPDRRRAPQRASAGCGATSPRPSGSIRKAAWSRRSPPTTPGAASR